MPLKSDCDVYKNDKECSNFKENCEWNSKFGYNYNNETHLGKWTGKCVTKSTKATKATKATNVTKKATKKASFIPKGMRKSKNLLTIVRYRNFLNRLKKSEAIKDAIKAAHNKKVDDIKDELEKHGHTNIDIKLVSKLLSTDKYTSQEAKQITKSILYIIKTLTDFVLDGRGGGGYSNSRGLLVHYETGLILDVDEIIQNMIKYNKLSNDDIIKQIKQIEDFRPPSLRGTYKDP